MIVYLTQLDLRPEQTWIGGTRRWMPTTDLFSNQLNLKCENERWILFPGITSVINCYRIIRDAVPKIKKEWASGELSVIYPTRLIVQPVTRLTQDERRIKSPYFFLCFNCGLFNWISGIFTYFKFSGLTTAMELINSRENINCI